MKDKCICPRCGSEMVGGLCEECGFPINAKRVLFYQFEDDDNIIRTINDVVWARKL